MTPDLEIPGDSCRSADGSRRLIESTVSGLKRNGLFFVSGSNSTDGHYNDFHFSWDANDGLSDVDYNELCIDGSCSVQLYRKRE